jgi:hypothetical protein
LGFWRGTISLAEPSRMKLPRRDRRGEENRIRVDLEKVHSDPGFGTKGWRQCGYFHSGTWNTSTDKMNSRLVSPAWWKT